MSSKPFDHSATQTRAHSQGPMGSWLRLAVKTTQARALCSKSKSHLAKYFDHALSRAIRSIVPQRGVTRTQSTPF